ncbi:MAG: NAD(P)H-quinone oxidoreductase [Myxococcales bacterium]
MRAIVVRAPGGPEVLELGEAPDPVVGETDLLVRVRAAGVNRADLLQRLGRYPAPPGESPILGLEIAGEVERSGAAVAGSFAPGDRVMALLGGGGYAELARVPAAQAMRIPRGLDFAQAAAIPEAFLTSWLNLFLIGHLSAGEAVVVHAGASGVGTAALQVCRGVARVVFATASQRKHEACLSLGATHVLRREDVPLRLKDSVQQAAGGQGADLVFDLVGGAYLEANVAALARDGRLVCISTLSGSKATLDLGAVLYKRLSIVGSTLRSRNAEEKAKLVADFTAKGLPRFESGELRPVLAATFPLADAAQAHRRMESDDVVGKLVLLV